MPQNDANETDFGKLLTAMLNAPGFRFIDPDSFQRLMADQNRDRLLKKILKKILIKLQNNYTADEIKELLGAGRMTVYRWVHSEKISAYHTQLLLRFQNEIAQGENPAKHIEKLEDALMKLKNYKKILGSWSKLAGRIKVDRKTIWRWLKTGKISKGHLKILYYFFKESVDGLYRNEGPLMSATKGKIIIAG